MNAYAQPFHHVGGSGTHFGPGAKTITFPEGAPFQSSGFGMGPFNEKTTAVRDELLDRLQHAKLPGWEGEWFDSYEVEQFLAQQSISLPQGGGEGYVDIPPGEFYDNPLEERQQQNPQTKNNSSDSSSDSNMQGGSMGTASVAEGLSMPSQQQMGRNNNAPYPSSVSSIEGMLSIPAPADLWSSGTIGSNYLATMPSNNISSVMAYHGAGALGFPDSYGYSASPSAAINLVSGHMRNKRVWFSVDKFIESKSRRETSYFIC